MLLLLLIACAPWSIDDLDGDGYGALDCDDGDPWVAPGAPDVVGDGVDQSCDGVDGMDADGDGYASVASGGRDCDDDDEGVAPGAAERCDDVDQDCDGLVDEAGAEDASVEAWPDADGDAWGARDGGALWCSAPAAGWATRTGDCDDQDPSTYPGAREACSGVDEDCDGSVDEATIWFRDADGDGFGDASGVETAPACAPPEGYVADDQDCDDLHPSASPIGVEDCFNGLDDDCDGWADACAMSDLPGLSGAEAGVHLGFVAASGDLYGSGEADLLVSAWDPREGHAVLLLLEGPVDPEESLGAQIGLTVFDEARHSATRGFQDLSHMDIPGDIDGDGWDDLLVGARFLNEGGLYLIRGPLQESGSLEALSDVVLERAGGGGLVRAGDMTGDGLAEVFDSARGGQEATLYHGEALFDASPTRTTISLTDTWTAVAELEDLDGDGVSELLIAGADPGSVQPRAGGVLIFAGPLPPTLADQDALVALRGDARPLGYVGAGDFNGDGHMDLAVGEGGQSGPRDSFVLDGPTLTLEGARLRLVQVVDDLRSDCHIPSSGGDLEGDGRDDLALGCHPIGGSGEVRSLLFLSSGPLGDAEGVLETDAADARWSGSATLNRGADSGFVSGTQRLRWEDLDGDGRDDLTLGDLYADTSAEDAGALYILSGWQ